MKKPTDAELRILRVLWECGPSTVREVHEHLGSEGSYTTILKLLQIMSEKGLVKRDQSTRTHIYSVARAATETKKHLVRDLLEKAFSGSAKEMVMQALSAKRTSAGELAEIRKMIEEMERKNV
jgi:BlaI family transcriptional regulator, penicillinase repressor